jgi:ribonuclease VapC
MFVDASAICAILLGEPDARSLAEQIAAAKTKLISALAIYESVAAVARHKNGNVVTARRLVDRFVSAGQIEVVAIGQAEQEIALDAFDRYGKGRHPAKLNMGDCFAYACAKTNRVPLLFKGDDFSKTDIAAA